MKISSIANFIQIFEKLLLNNIYSLKIYKIYLKKTAVEMEISLFSK